MKVYAAARNSDQTEGRGQMVAFAYFVHLVDAIKAVKGEGVMGFNDGNVYYVEIAPVVFETYEQYAAERDRKTALDSTRLISDNLVYDGFKKIHITNAPVLDPEYADYLRLKQKFHG